MPTPLDTARARISTTVDLSNSMSYTDAARIVHKLAEADVDAMTQDVVLKHLESNSYATLLVIRGWRERAAAMGAVRILAAIGKLGEADAAAKYETAAFGYKGV